MNLDALQGRRGETLGNLLAALRITVAGRPLLHHGVAVGSGHRGWDGPAAPWPPSPAFSVVLATRRL
jgi:hypothetical protein